MPIFDPHTLDFTSHSPEQTLRYGVRLGQLLQAGDLVCLDGELGVGKTTLAVGLGRGWGALQNVTSPTFVLVNEYQRADGAQLHHLDCYRLSSYADVESVSLEERLDADVTLLIEWPENIEQWLPADRLWITLEYLEDEKRTIRLSAAGGRYEELLDEYRQAVFGTGVVA